jgi:tRNA(Ile)-lysidine synthase
MRVLRGTGPRGLGGIYPRMEVEGNDDEEDPGEIIRPLLGVRKSELEVYLQELGQAWRDDSTNADDSFTRNRVRQLLVPLLEKEFNPRLAQTLSDLATIARGEEDYWDNEIAGWMNATIHASLPKWAKGQSISLLQIQPAGTPQTAAESEPEGIDISVNRGWFLAEPLAAQRRVIKAIGEEAGIPLEFRHVEEILHFSTEENSSSKHLSLPHGWKLFQEEDRLLFLAPNPRQQELEPSHYEYSLPVPGRVAIPEAGMMVQARWIEPSAGPPEYNREQLLRAELLETELRVRNWRPGDRFWPAHTKAPGKIKELLQKRHIPQAQRRVWPVLVSGEEIVWVRDFPLPEKWQAQSGERAVLIEELSLSTHEKAADTPLATASSLHDSRRRVRS